MTNIHTRSAMLIVAITTVIALMLLAVALPQFTFLNEASAATSKKVKISNGITLDEMKYAYLNGPIAMDEVGLQSVNVFTKAGGVPADELEQPNLKFDFAASTIGTGSDRKISFQYFVDVANDITPSPIQHCADLKLHILVDGKRVYTTDWMGYDDRSPALPLTTDKISISKVSAGDHMVTLIPEGIGGCIVGNFVFSWGGTAVVFK